MPRNYGQKNRALRAKPYVNIRPKGCECSSWPQAERCSEWCYRDLEEPRQSPGENDGIGTIDVSLPVVCIIIALICACLAIVLWPVPARPADVPFYCKPLTRFDRSCGGVREAAAVLGKEHARSLAKRCGATPAELASADECMKPAPVWKCTPRGDWNAPNCANDK
jgi:hypothetical protein